MTTPRRSTSLRRILRSKGDIAGSVAGQLIDISMDLTDAGMATESFACGIGALIPVAQATARRYRIESDGNPGEGETVPGPSSGASVEPCVGQDSEGNQCHFRRGHSGPHSTPGFHADVMALDGPGDEPTGGGHDGPRDPPFEEYPTEPYDVSKPCARQPCRFVQGHIGPHESGLCGATIGQAGKGVFVCALPAGHPDTEPHAPSAR